MVLSKNFVCKDLMQMFIKLNGETNNMPLNLLNLAATIIKCLHNPLLNNILLQI